MPSSRGNRGMVRRRVGTVKKDEEGKKKNKKKTQEKKRRSERGFGGGGKPEKLRTKEIKLMSFLEGAESERARARGGFARVSTEGRGCCVSPAGG